MIVGSLIPIQDRREDGWHRGIWRAPYSILLKANVYLYKRGEFPPKRSIRTKPHNDWGIINTTIADIMWRDVTNTDLVEVFHADNSHTHAIIHYIISRDFILDNVTEVFLPLGANTQNVLQLASIRAPYDYSVCVHWDWDFQAIAMALNNEVQNVIQI